MINIDSSHYPLIIARWVGTVSLADYNAHVGEMEPLFARAVRDRDHIALVVDSSQQREVEPLARKAMAESAPVDCLVGTWATMNPVVKLVLTALKWLGAKNLTTLTPCTSLPEALAGAASALRSKGARFSPATESMLARISAA